MNTSITFSWLGVGAIELAYKDQLMLVDPFFSRPQFWFVFGGRPIPDQKQVSTHVQRCNHVLITHAHFDHLMDVPEIIHQTGANAYGPANACVLLDFCGVDREKIQQVRAGDQLTLGDWQVYVLPGSHLAVPGFGHGPLAKHLKLPLRLRDFRMDTCNSYLLEVGNLRVLVWHNTGVEGAPFADIAFVGSEHSEKYYIDLIERVSPKAVVLIHWENLFMPLSSPCRPFFKPTEGRNIFLRKISLDNWKLTIERNYSRIKCIVPERFLRYSIPDLWEGHQ